MVMISSFYRIAEWFKKRTLLEQVLLCAFLLGFILYGGTKPTNNVPRRMVMPKMGQSAGNEEPFSLTELSSVQLTTGVAISEVRTNDVHDFSIPSNAIPHNRWLKRGANKDAFPLALTNFSFRLGTNVYDELFVSSSGILSFGLPILSSMPNDSDVNHLAPLRANLGIVPEANWHLVSAGDSKFWHMESPSNTAVFTWQNVLFNRETNFPIAFQTELFKNGDFVYRYDLSSLANVTNWQDTVSIGVRNDGTNENYSHTTLPTTILFKHLLPTDTPTNDRDGDGISTADEIFIYRTDPSLPDTDCDGLSDVEEIARGTNPLIANTDGDGFIDGSDPDPISPTSLADNDNDGIPDAYENHWFGGTNVLDTATDRDETGFMLADKFAAGMNPINGIPDGSVVITNQLVSWKLFDGFMLAPAERSTNLIWERTFAINRQSKWEQYFISANPTNAASWKLQGATLEWETNERVCGSVTMSPNDDSFKIPLAPIATPSTITLRLKADADAVAGNAAIKSPNPLYLIAYTPELKFNGSVEVEGNSGGRFYVYQDGTDSKIVPLIDRSKRPCRAPASADEGDLNEILAGAEFEYDVVHGEVKVLHPGVYSLPSIKIGASMSPVRRSPKKRGGGGAYLVIIDPYVTCECDGDVYFGDELSYNWTFYGYEEVTDYPLGTKKLRELWRRSYYRGCICYGTPIAVVVSGVGENNPWVTTGASGLTGYVYVDGTEVWSDTTEHDPEGESYTEDRHKDPDPDPIDPPKDNCACENGFCDAYETPELGSIRFRIPLGNPTKDHISGFVWFAANDPVSISESTFNLLSHPDADIEEQMVSGNRRITCNDSRGRDLLIKNITHGVRITIKDTASQSLEHTWEITNVNGHDSVVRFRKISRQNNVMLDETYTHHYDGCWIKYDNISGLGTMLTIEDNLNYNGTKRETRVTTDATGATLSTTVTEKSRIGEFDNAILRTTYTEENSGRNVTWSRYDYWCDPPHPKRHGKCRLMTSNERTWIYSDYDEKGRLTLRIKPRNNSTIPNNFPYVVSNVLHNAESLKDAFATVYDYTPHAGDSNHIGDSKFPRTETKYLITSSSSGTMNHEPRTMNLIRHRYTRLMRNGYEAVKHETWRASDETMQSHDNAYSYEIRYASGGANTPLLMRNAVAESRNENGIVTINTYSQSNGKLTCESHYYNGVIELPTYETTVQDATYGTLLRTTIRLASNGAIINDEQSTYDEKNRLRSRSFFDGWNVVAEFVAYANGTSQTIEYFWSDDLSNSAQGAGGVGGLLAVSVNGSYYFPTYDFNGNVTAYVTESGQLAAWYAYDGFGNSIDSYSDTSSFSFRFSTKYLDAEIGMYYYGRRFYLPHLGRWFNRDPIEEDGGENLYAFCKNNGLMYFDYFGMDFWGYVFDAVNILAEAFTVKTGAGLAIAAGWTGIGAVAGLSLMALGGDQILHGMHSIYNRMKDKAIPEGSPVQIIYRSAAERITDKEDSGLEYALDSLYFGAQVISACATANISVNNSIGAVRHIGSTKTVRRLVKEDGYLRYQFYLTETVSIYEAGVVVTTETFSTVLSFIGFFEPTEELEEME